MTYLVAAAVLTYMTFWMQAHSRTMSAELQRRSEDALEGRTRWGLGLLAFQAVGREGLETMVFTLAIVFASTNQAPTAARGHGLLLGAVLGLFVALGIAYAIFKLGKRLNLGLFFRIIGVVLMVFAAGLLVDAVENMQQLGWLPFLDHTLWNSSSYLSESSSIGDVFHSLLGYADHPTVLQAIVWVTYLGVATTAFIVMGRRGRTPPVPVPAVSTTAAAAGGSHGVDPGERSVATVAGPGPGARPGG